MTELDLLRARRPESPPPDDDVRQRSRAVLAEAIRDEQAPTRRPVGRLLPALGVVSAIAVAAVVGIGVPETAPDAGPQPWSLRPEPAGALTQVDAAEDGVVEIRFLHPDADPERIREELAEHGFDLDVQFVPSDPFSVGTMVYAEVPEGSEPIETLREGNEITGGGVGHDIGIRVPEDWTGEGYAIAIGRAALPGESFDSTVALNAERPGGPLHCAGVRGTRPAEAADIVEQRGYRVVWRTEQRGLMGTRTTEEEPPADHWVADAIWHSEDEIILFARAERPAPRRPATAELVESGCDEAGR